MGGLALIALQKESSPPPDLQRDLHTSILLLHFPKINRVYSQVIGAAGSHVIGSLKLGLVSLIYALVFLENYQVNRTVREFYCLLR
jgi:hypothetical protein